MADHTHGFRPDYAIRPGEILEETLAARGMKKTEFAERCGRPAKTISEIIAGKAAITPETAIQFERVLGVPASLWTNLETRYRLRLAEQAEGRELAKFQDWAQGFPIREMVGRGLIDEPADETHAVQVLLDYLGAGSVPAWLKHFEEFPVAYRRSPSFESAPNAVAAWLRWGEIVAANIDCDVFDEKRFRQVLHEIRSLTAEPPATFQPQMKELCRSAGVAVVFTPELPRTRLSGAARWLTKEKALIQLSLRYRSDDHLWFTFFHEAGHIILHGKKEAFIDERGIERSEQEDEADRFATNFLIPPPDWRRFVRASRFTPASVTKFAKEQVIAPGIVVGRLQYEKYIPFNSRLNRLKVRFQWSFEKN